MQPATTPGDRQGFALWNLGFRPFYLLASVFAAISVPAWVCQYTGWLPVAYVQGSMWHGHEMIFGFATAVIAGFLLTAVPNWTQEPTPTGRNLAALALLWVAGRILAPTPFAAASIVVNAAFPLAIATAIAIPLWKSANRRNYFFAFLLAGMSVALAAFHLASRDSLAVEPRVGLQAALDNVLFIMALVGGRVIPMFTNNGVPGTRARRDPRLEKLALGSLIALLACDLLQLASVLPYLLAFAAAAHALRLVLWQPWRTGPNAMVWILHVAYGWIVVHLALRALAMAGLVAPPLALHALAIGAIGSLTIGMMTRTARGHTGYPIRAGKAEVACFVLIQLAAVLRVFGAMLLPGAYVGTVVASGALWAAAYATYAIRYWPILTRPRIDGRPG
ncbi:MAG: NnrS family protein [Usitatibacter sp.]